MSLELTRSRPVDRLLTLEEPALERALAEVTPALAATAVAAAPSLNRKTTLLWAMEDRQRREALELVPPAVIGALIQNLEEDNRYLLGDLSLVQFRALLALCSPERKYYWIATALSFPDVRANALPLLLPTRELVEILFTRAEFEAHIRAIAEFPVEHARIPDDLALDPARAVIHLVGADQFLRQFPVGDPNLAQIIQLVLDYDPDRYADMIREGLRLADYVESHPEEWEELTEAPVLLDTLASPTGTSPSEAPDALFEPEGPPLALVPLTAPPLVRVTAALPPARQEQLNSEMQELFIRQAVAEGGSFLLSDLHRVARGVEAYLLLGLRAESEGRPDSEPDVLASRPAHKVVQSGARLMEALRQVAFRLAPLSRWLSPDWRALVRSLSHPRLTLGPDGEPRITLLPAESLPEDADYDTAREMLLDAAAWTEMARALGLERTAEALEAAGSVDRLLEELALGAVLFARIEPGLAQEGDRARFHERYVSRADETPTPAARAGLRRVVQAWARQKSLDYDRSLNLLEAALERLARIEPG